MRQDALSPDSAVRHSRHIRLTSNMCTTLKNIRTLTLFLTRTVFRTQALSNPKKILNLNNISNSANLEPAAADRTYNRSSNPMYFFIHGRKLIETHEEFWSLVVRYFLELPSSNNT
jgi:hypothetical protein